MMSRTGRSALKEVGLAVLVRFTEWVAAFERRAMLARERRALARLDEVALKDIGLTRADAMREASRGWLSQHAETDGDHSPKR